MAPASARKRTTKERSGSASLADASRIWEDLEAIRGVLREAAWQHARAHRVSLTPPQVFALQLLVEELRGAAGGLSLSELSRRMGLAHSTVSGIVSRLESRQLVERVTRSDDRRFISIELTERVKEWVEDELVDSRLAPLVSALEGAQPSRRAAILRGLRDLRALLTVHEAEAESETGTGSRRPRRGANRG